MDNNNRPPPHVTDDTSLTLLERVRVRDVDAWQRLVDLYGPLVFGWCRRCGLDSPTAADVTQDTFAAVARAIADFRRDASGGSFRGWLRVIARNKIREHFRRAPEDAAAGGSTAYGRLAQVSDGQLNDSMTGDPSRETRELYERAVRILQSEFEQHTWKAFWAVAVEGRATGDVAADLGMTAGAVRQAKYKVLRRLRTEFEGLIDADAVTPPAPG